MRVAEVQSHGGGAGAGKLSTRGLFGVALGDDEDDSHAHAAGSKSRDKQNQKARRDKKGNLVGDDDGVADYPDEDDGDKLDLGDLDSSPKKIFGGDVEMGGAEEVGASSSSYAAAQKQSATATAIGGSGASSSSSSSSVRELRARLNEGRIVEVRF